MLSLALPYESTGTALRLHLALCNPAPTIFSLTRRLDADDTLLAFSADYRPKHTIPSHV